MDGAATDPSDGRTDERGLTGPPPPPGLARRGGSGPETAAPAPASPVGRERPSGGPTASRDRSTADGRRHNLPHPIASFVGRDREIAEVGRLLATTRLLTLTGAGGVGKTRLAHEVAVGVLDDYPDGVWLVELAALADPALVPRAAAAVMGVREEPDRPQAATLADALASRRLLLVLDNCEHLIEACAALAHALLRACPGLRILATSRQALGIDGETTFRVPSLSLAAPAGAQRASGRGEAEARQPGAGTPPAPDVTEPPAQSEAVRLFVERALAAQPTFALTDRNAPAVAEICRRLDGIPLAIELAAARVAVLSPEQIETRLGDRFRLLTGGSRMALPRYRTLEALVDWSHDLLSDPQRVLLRRLAVFAGGWTLEAAEGVASGELPVASEDGSLATGSSPLATPDVLELLAGLVDQSLVLAEERDAEVRYRSLETLREYAAERLRDAGEEAALRGRHRDWFLAFAERAEPELRGPHAVEWLDRLDRERENLWAALGWCIEREEAGPGLRLAGALTRLWLVRGPYRETRATVADLLALPAAREPTAPMRAARAKALNAAGRLAMRQDDPDAADLYHREALAISRQLGDRRRLAIALFEVGHVARVRRDYPAAQGLHEESRREFEALGDDYWLAEARHELGVAAFFQGDLATAREHYEASLALYRGLADEVGIVSALNDLGEVALLRGELEAARSLEVESLEMARRIDDKERVAMALAALAGVAAAEGRPARALRLAAAADALNEATGQRNSPAWRAMVERWLEPARRALSAEACAAARAEGRAMLLDEAVEYALVADAPAAAGPAQQVTQSSRAAGGLTPREEEVAALIARGLSNRQIAEELVIAEGTAANHVKHILTKLGLDSRLQIAAWAIDLGLHHQPPS
jgi:non-specific serine/threonine protein kinase